MGSRLRGNDRENGRYRNRLEATVEKSFLWITLICLIPWTTPQGLGADVATWDCEVFPSEREVTFDEESGAKVTFVTGTSGDDANLYFHQRSWLPDGSLLFFFRQEEDGPRTFSGYLEETGEIVRIQKPDQSLFGLPTAARYANEVYVAHDQALWAWEIETVFEPKTRVTVTEKKICDIPEEMGSLSGLNENSDGTRLVFGGPVKDSTGSLIVAADKETGEIQEVARTPFPAGHIQCSWDNPDLVMFNHQRSWKWGDHNRFGGPYDHRMWLADLSDRAPWKLYPTPATGELTTHECWWVDNQVVFCSGTHWNQETGAEESHVKVIDVDTGVARIIGAGSWVEGVSPRDLAKRNWWHSSGDPTGRFVAGDNWHGDIAIFSAQSARERLLVQNHRTYGGGAHPHMGWSPDGKKLVFASNRRGNVDVCIAEIPVDWFADW